MENVFSSSPRELATGAEVSFNESGEFIELNYSHGITAESLNDAYIKLLEHPNFVYNINACYDFLDAYPDMEMSDIEEHALFVSRLHQQRGNDYKVALVTSDPLTTALLKAFNLLTTKNNLKAKLFNDKDRAKRWLARKD